MKRQKSSMLCCPACGGESLLVAYYDGLLGIFCEADWELVCGIEVDDEFEDLVDELQYEAHSNKPRKK